MSLSEFDIIKKYFQAPSLALNKPEVVLGVGDDAALISVPSEDQLAISTDVLVESVHFPIGADPAKIATRALAVNLSDLAAMGARPLCFSLGLVLPEVSEVWLAKFSEGLSELAQRFDIALIGGDLSRGPTTIAIQVQGTVPEGTALRRDSAQIGDAIFVTGSLGDGVIALASMGLPTHLGNSFQLESSPPAAKCKEYFENAYFSPEPKIEFAQACSEFISSAIDVSDGLVGDLSHICNRSGVGARLNIDKLPFSDSARCCVSNANLIRAALYGGDDYQLCVTVAQNKIEDFLRAAQQNETEVSCIGEIVEGDSVSLRTGAGDNWEVEETAYQHFKVSKD